jgi:hypothetical protein
VDGGRSDILIPTCAETDSCRRRVPTAVIASAAKQSSLAASARRQQFWIARSRLGETAKRQGRLRRLAMTMLLRPRAHAL